MLDTAVERFSNPLKSVLTRAFVLAAEKKSPVITPEHVLFALATQPTSPGSVILSRARISLEQLQNYLEQSSPASEHDQLRPELSESTQKILEKAILTARLYNHPFITTAHVLFGFLHVEDEALPNLLFRVAKIERKALEEHLTQILQQARKHTIDEVPEQGAKGSPCSHCGEAHEEEGDSALAFFTKEITDQEYLKQHLSFVGRSSELDRIITILSRKTKNHPLLLGDPGVGKTAIVEGLARRILAGDVPESLKKARIFSLNMGDLLAGAMYRGDFEARFMDMLEELQNTKGAIVFIDEFHTLMHAGGGQGSVDAANMIKPALARPGLRVIGATTHEEYKKHIEHDGALTRRMHPLIVREPNKEETLGIARKIAKDLARHHGATYSTPVIETAYRLCEQHLPHRRFPDKLLDILDEAGALAKGKSVLENHIVTATAHAAGTSLPSPDHKSELFTRITASLRDAIVGQDRAIEHVVRALARAELGISSSERPKASFLFAGPSGVGKTELAKRLAKTLSSEKKAYLRLDMSEYHESHSVSKLIGSPAGYVGYKERAQLTDAVKECPHIVIVFDELEKAHRSVHHLLLQILEEGELRDGSGGLVHFRNATIIATTNAGREAWESQHLGFTKQEISKDERVKELLRDRFSPELLQRFDAICAFHPLTKEHLVTITDHHIQRLLAHLKIQGFTLKLPKNLAQKLAATKNLRHGRDVRTLLQTTIEDPLAEHLALRKRSKKILSGTYSPEGKILFH